MQPGSTGAHQDPEQGAPDPSPENKVEVATPDLDAVAANKYIETKRYTEKKISVG